MHNNILDIVLEIYNHSAVPRFKDCVEPTHAQGMIFVQNVQIPAIVVISYQDREWSACQAFS